MNNGTTKHPEHNEQNGNSKALPSNYYFIQSRLNSLSKRHRMAEWIKKKIRSNNMLPTRDLLCPNDTHRLSEEMEKEMSSNGNQVTTTKHKG